MEVKMKAEKCPKCGHETFICKHKGPHIGWYCAKCGTWVRWIKQNKIATQEQMSMEDFGVTLPEERTCKCEIEDVNSLYDDDSLPWE